MRRPLPLPSRLGVRQRGSLELFIYCAAVPAILFNTDSLCGLIFWAQPFLWTLQSLCAGRCALYGMLSIFEVPSFFPLRRFDSWWLSTAASSPGCGYRVHSPYACRSHDTITVRFLDGDYSLFLRLQLIYTRGAAPFVAIVFGVDFIYDV
jgi:hypothetical protein